MKTTIIKNCTLIDGSGKPAIKKDIAFQGDKISAIESSLPQTGVDNVIDACGKVLAPGFIDAHSHSDISILAAPEATGKISQGITTDIIGNCGLSVFPVSNHNREYLQSLYKNYNVDITWSDLHGYVQELLKRQPAINIATLCGHNSLRSSILGYKDVEVHDNNLEIMKCELNNSLSKGAKGFSTGLLYTPGKFADYREILQLLSILPQYGGVYASHIRNEGDRLIESIEEAIELSTRAKLFKLHISHLKASQPRNWSKLDSVLELIQNCSRNQLTITADRYPYTESMTQLSVILPPPYDSMPDAKIEMELKDDLKFEQLVNELSGYDTHRWSNIRIANTLYAPVALYIGEKISDIATALNISAHLLCAKLIRANSTGTMAIFSGMSPKNLRKILKQDFVCCGSDESARPLDYSIGRSHPRGFGSIARFINLQKELGIPLEESVRRITSLPATIFGLHGRGAIKTGFFADLVLFDPELLNSDATFEKPHTISDGVLRVWVNGKESYSLGESRFNRYGRFI